MTNVNHNPTNDFPIGRLGIEEADTEGHIKVPHLTEDDEFDRHVEEADTEGHLKFF